MRNSLLTKAARSAAGALVASLLSTAAAYAYSEAPMLSEKVAAGLLPPVAERLPDAPRVIEPYESIGTYGGTWRRAFTGPGDDRGPQKLMEPRIVRFVQTDEDSFGLEPTWVSGVEVDETSTAFTFTIREGLKWSDGAPVTTEDVRFYFEDFIGNDTIERWPGTLKSASGNASLTVIDDLTFTITFPDPSPLFLSKLARDYTWIAMPKHYLSQFHPNYATEAELAAAAAAFGVETWKDLWGRRGKAESFWLNPAVPTLSPWVITVPPPAEQVVFERNPYYYAVDTEGNQLPYIDRITHDLFQDAETLKLWVVQGRIDLQQRHIRTGDFPFFKENEAAGGYEVVTWRSLDVETLWPNQTGPDAVMADLFRDARFREALNIAIDREAVNELVFAGLATPMQAGPAKGSAIYSEALVAKWAEYDPGRANALLDEMGLTARDGDGYRLRPDGQTLDIVLTTALFASDIKVLELVTDFWKDVGVKVSIDLIERGAYIDRTANNDVVMGHWPMGRAANFLIDTGAYSGRLADSPWAPAWGNYLDTNDKPYAAAPPEGHMLHEVWDLIGKAEVAASEAEAFDLGEQILDLHAEAPNWIGIVGGAPNLFIRSNRLKNFPENFIRDDITRDIGIIPTEQLFIAE
jgi:peptide/nickel transport system substrate-binding protein